MADPAEASVTRESGRAGGRLAHSLVGGSLVVIAVFIYAAFLDYEQRREQVAMVAQGPDLERLSALARAGMAVFGDRCASCHGRRAAGTGRGPSLLLARYGAARFGDDAIVKAIEEGVAQRQWRFGNMPPIAGLTNQELVSVVRFIREAQIAAEVQ